jgi:hypothetical protein
LKGIAVFLIALFIFPLVVAESTQVLGTFKKGQAVNLKQICSNCSYNNITSVIYPNSSLALGNVPMTKIGTEYNYTLIGTRTGINGEYIVNGVGDLDGINTIWTYSFYITNNGDTVDTGQGMLYIIAFVFGLSLFALFLFGAVKINGKNETDESGEYWVKVNWNKYIKIFCVSFAYLTMMWLLWMSFNISSAYLGFEGASTFLERLYRIMVAGVRPLFIITVIFMVVKGIKDLKLQEKIKTGYGINTYMKGQR